MIWDEYIEDIIFEIKCFSALHKGLTNILFGTRNHADYIPFAERFRRKIKHNTGGWLYEYYCAPVSESGSIMIPELASVAFFASAAFWSSAMSASVTNSSPDTVDVL